MKRVHACLKGGCCIKVQTNRSFIYPPAHPHPYIQPTTRKHQQRTHPGSATGRAPSFSSRVKKSWRVANSPTERAASSGRMR